MAVYQAGFINATNGSNVLEGLGTYWLTYIKVGDTITLSGTVYYIVAISDNHLLELHTAYTGVTLLQGVYQIDIAVKPSKYHYFNTVTLTWVSATPSPTISSLVATIGFKKLSFTWNILDSIYEGIGYSTEIWHSSTNDFATAVLHTTTIDRFFEDIDLTPVPQYYWFRAVYSPDAILGATTASGGQTPLAVQTTDLALGAATIFSFGRTDTPITANPAGLVSIANFIIVNNSLTEELPVEFQVACRQLYSAGLRQTRWAFFNNTDSAFLLDTGILVFADELPTLTTCTGIPAGTTKSISLYWWAEDTSVSLTYRDYRIMGLKR